MTNNGVLNRKSLRMILELSEIKVKNKYEKLRQISSSLL